MTATSLDAGALRALMGTFRDALTMHREVLNLLNVYPVPDGDTGSNMAMTADSVVAELDSLDDGTAAEMAQVTVAISHGSLMGARGNSGVILSQVLRGLSGVFADAGAVDGRVLADGLAAASTAAYAAVMRPVEGTILTVVRESAAAAVVAADSGGDLLVVAEPARAAGADARHGGCDELIIRTESKRGDGREWILVHVTDTGPGLDPTAAPRIFQPYFSTRSGGTGLGLPTARRIIEEHGGFIEVQSVKGKGSQFSVYLPLERKET